ncbi:MAG: hypothetical protein WC867_03185 [Candidatus Pacearchaeota archaeon]|jgi:hypothetical protein
MKPSIENGSRNFDRRIYHLTLKLQQDPIVVTPVSYAKIPDISKPGLFLLGLELRTDDKNFVQFNYNGELKPYQYETVKKLALEETASTCYYNLEKQVEILRMELEQAKIIELDQNSDGLILYTSKPDEEIVPQDLSVITFGYGPSHKPGKKLFLKYAGDIPLVKISEIYQEPTNLPNLIKTKIDEINQSLKKRNEEWEKKQIQERKDEEERK